MKKNRVYIYYAIFYLAFLLLIPIVNNTGNVKEYSDYSLKVTGIYGK